MKEFFFGDDQEKASQDEVKKLQKLQKTHRGLNSAQRRRLDFHKPIADRVTRRRLIAAISTGSALTLLGAGVIIDGRIISIDFRSEESATDQLDKYKERAIPSDVMLQIAQEMAQQTDLPQVASSGRLISQQIQEPQIIEPFISFAPRDPRDIRPITYKMVSGDRKTIASINQPLHYQSGRLTLPKVSGGSIQIIGYEAKTEDLVVELNEDTVTQGTTPYTTYILLAKEVGQLTLFPEQKQLTLEELRKLYVIPSDPMYENILFSSALIISSDHRTSLQSDMFDNAEKIFDMAGYWFIIPDTMTLESTGKLNRNDKRELEYPIRAGEWAKDRGYLRTNEHGGFTWREDVRPFSKAWRDLIDEVYRSFNDDPDIRPQRKDMAK